MNYYHDIMQLIGTAVDAVGVMIMVIGAVVSTVHFVGHRRPDFSGAYRSYRQGLGRAILLGPEFLIAGDIIRTFVSMALQLEVEGRWPWRRADELQPSSH